MQAAEALVDWYGAMFRLAFGVGRSNGKREPETVATPAVMPQIEAEKSLPVVSLHRVPSAPVKLRPKRRKSRSVAKNRSRSSKASSARRNRRAA
jgi:hypothetical protein